MDGESEGLRRQVVRLELTIQAEMEKGKVLQVTFLLSIHWIHQTHSVSSVLPQPLLALVQDI
jgi:hypothetical protein